jgi:hypothetical protein
VENLIGASQPTQSQRYINVKHTLLWPEKLIFQEPTHTHHPLQTFAYNYKSSAIAATPGRREKKKKPSNYLSGSVFLRLIKAGWLYTHINTHQRFLQIKKKYHSKVIIYIQCVLRARERWFVDLAKGGDKHIQRSLSVCVVCAAPHSSTLYSVSRLIWYQKSKAFLKRLYAYIYLVLGIIVIRDLQR